MTFHGFRQFISQENRERYRAGLCPVAEQLAPRLLQFKTNYWDMSVAEQQADVLRKTLQSF